MEIGCQRPEDYYRAKRINALCNAIMAGLNGSKLVEAYRTEAAMATVEARHVGVNI